jgi:hypothetical protein
MSAADARIARFACGVGHFDAHPARREHALLVAGAERHEFDRIRATQAGLHALAHRVKVLSGSAAAQGASDERTEHE